MKLGDHPGAAKAASRGRSWALSLDRGKWVKGTYRERTDRLVWSLSEGEALQAWALHRNMSYRRILVTEGVRRQRLELAI